MTLVIAPVTTYVLLNTEDKKPLKNQAQNLQTRLRDLNVDGFVRQHEIARKAAISMSKPGIEGDITDLRYDRQFSSPAERYQHLLERAQYYQQDSVIDLFSREESDAFDARVRRRKKTIATLEKEVAELEDKKLDLENQKESLKNDLEKREEIIRKNVIKTMLYKLNLLESLFNESQALPDSNK